MRSKRRVQLPQDLGDLDGDMGPVWPLLPSRPPGAGTPRRARVPAEATAHGPRLTLTRGRCLLPAAKTVILLYPPLTWVHVALVWGRTCLRPQVARKTSIIVAVLVEDPARGMQVQ